jgi:hypothetical protein
MLLSPALLLSALLSAPSAPGVQSAPPIVSWQDLCDHPSRWLGKKVRLRLQYQGRVADWNPYLTRFGSRRYAAIQAWSDEQLPWVRSDFDAPFVRLFFPRGESCAMAFDQAQVNDRYEVTAIVREVFLDVPWTEVLEVVPLAERIGEGTIIHAGKALELMQKRDWKLADLEIEQAITDSLPPPARAELERLRAECREAAAASKLPGRSKIEVRPSH